MTNLHSKDLRRRAPAVDTRRNAPSQHRSLLAIPRVRDRWGTRVFAPREAPTKARPAGRVRPRTGNFQILSGGAGGCGQSNLLPQWPETDRRRAYWLQMELACLSGRTCTGSSTVVSMTFVPSLAYPMIVSLNISNFLP